MANTKMTPARGRARPPKVVKGAKVAKKKVQAKAASNKRRSASNRAKGKVAGKAKPSSSSTAAASASGSGRAKPGTVAHQSAFAKRNWAKLLVFKGKKVKTSTGLFKRDLLRNKRGSIVSKRKSAIGKRRYQDNNLDLWTRSFMQARSEHGIKGFVLLKKSGNTKERSLFSSTRAKWQDLVAARMMNSMQSRPEILGKISKMLAADGSGAAAATTTSSSSSSSKVKVEGAEGPLRNLVPGDSVRVQKGAADWAYRGQTGTVERFQLGRVVVNFSGTLKAVKVEDLAKM